MIANHGCPSNAADVDLLRLGRSSTGRYRHDLPMMPLWAAPAEDRAEWDCEACGWVHPPHVDCLDVDLDLDPELAFAV